MYKFKYLYAVEFEPLPPNRPKTLMDFAYCETSWPKFKNTDQVTYLDKGLIPGALKTASKI